MTEINKVCVVAAGAIGSLLVGHLGTVVDMAVLARRDERAKIARTDLPNARMVRAGRSAAEIVIDDARCL